MSEWNTPAHSAMQIRDVPMFYLYDYCRDRYAMAALVLEVVALLTCRACQPMISVILSQYAFGTVLESCNVEVTVDGPDFENPKAGSLS